jgi:hypothetical protein
MSTTDRTPPRRTIAGSGHGATAIGSERLLIQIAAALAGDAAAWSEAERALVDAPGQRELLPPDPVLLAPLRDMIRAGADPLGDTFCRLRSAAERRARGATYTPADIVDAMLAWAAGAHPQPVRVIDPGAGSGRFISAAATQFPLAALIAVEPDPLAALMLRANARVRGFADRLELRVADYRDIVLPPTAGATLFIGNPPYVRHHGIDAARKDWFAATAADLHLKASKLAGLHLHFFLKTATLARDGDVGCFITAAEWLDVNYGSLLRRLLCGRLGATAIHLIAAETAAFPDAQTTAAITCFRIGAPSSRVLVSSVGDRQRIMRPARTRHLPLAALRQSERWSPLIRSDGTREGRHRTRVGDLFRVHRGQVTGANAVWIAGPEAGGLPPEVLYPAITRAQELFAAGPALNDATVLKRVIDLPADLDQLPAAARPAVERFLARARTRQADQGYIARHRRAWWSVGLRAPAPILCTYMARRPPAFVRNRCAARHLNIAHGLYPREPLTEALLTALVAWLRENVTLDAGRTYAGGLVKFEPGEIERISIPTLEELSASAAPLVAR